MTAITRNLPWFIHDLGVSIVGQKCYTSLVENLDISDLECLKYSLSKGLGLGIVVGGSVMKVPQLLLILSARSARGLSLPAYTLETLAYAITTAYSFRHAFPFSTYGENLFLALQNILITLLILALPTPSLRRAQNVPARIAIASFAALATAGLLAVLPEDALGLAQMATLPLSLGSKIPQIRQNARAGSTGQLSAIAVGAQIAGCLARLFTTATEVGDSLVAAGFALALALNVVLGVQIWMYWGKDEREGVREREETLGKPRLVGVGGSGSEKVGTGSRVEVVVPMQSPVRRQSPIPRSSTPTGRKWSRKVD